MTLVDIFLHAILVEISTPLYMKIFLAEKYLCSWEGSSHLQQFENIFLCKKLLVSNKFLYLIEIKFLYLREMSPVPLSSLHCVKSVHILRFSGPYFPAFGRKTERYGLSLRIQFECEKIRTRQTPNTDTFYAVYYFCYCCLHPCQYQLVTIFVTMSTIVDIEVWVS